MVLLFTYNGYQGSIWLSSANVMSGKVYETNAHVEHFFALSAINEQLTKRNLYLEQQVDILSSQLAEKTGDSSVMLPENMEALKGVPLHIGESGGQLRRQSNNLITIDRVRLMALEKIWEWHAAMEWWA